MTFEQLVQALADLHYDVQFGRHAQHLSGYYARVEYVGPYCLLKADDPDEWDKSDHGHTLLCALINALEIVVGVNIAVSDTSFE